MRPLLRLFGLFPALLDAASAINIFVSHYQGTVQSLTLTATSGGAYTLTTNSTITIGGQPSWLTWDSPNRVLYVADEGNSGSVTSITAGTDGSLKKLGQCSAPGGAVANTLYANGGYIASVHYGTSLLTTFKLPLSSSSRPLQQMTLTMSGKGPNSRQDAPHPHETVVDPTGAFVLVPDLGADLIRIFSIDASSGKLTSCGNSVQTPGTGPRHAAFYGNKTLFVANELANTVNRFSVAYTGGCITLTKEQSSNTMAGGKAAPSGTKVGEVHVHDDFIIVSNRRDLSFSPNDSMATFSLDPTTAAMTLTGVTSSGGTYPRTFQINKAGDLVVIGDQTTANVVVVKRDVTTGLLGPQVASMRIGTVGHAESDDGLSAVFWDE
ncbi:putative isomerase YbhE [Stipitochalara longipes BDJ]|nr:putative isomerase YbhE [Stipitochalara longipes BDJ]